MIEVTILLISIDLLFLVFVWIQFAYLFGGQANITIEGFTYAEYARRGFLESAGFRPDGARRVLAAGDGTELPQLRLGTAVVEPTR